MKGLLQSSKRPAILRRADDGPTKQHRQHAEKQHEQQQSVVKGVGIGRFEYPIVRNVAAKHGPRPDVHQDQQLDDVDEGEHRGEERAQPNHAWRRKGWHNLRKN